jgi:hypothetical protein
MRPNAVMGLTITALALALVPSAARADEDLPPLTAATPSRPAVTESAAVTEDAVHLRSGGLFRGRVTEIIPGDHVTILVPGSAAPHRVPWADVDRVIVASTAIPATPSVGPPAPPAPAVGPTAFVRLHSSGGNATLYRKPAGAADFVTACEAPCGDALPVGDMYKIGGHGITTTKEFRLQAAPGETVDLNVDGPSWVGIIGGGLLTIGGGVTMYVGVLLGLAGGGCSAGNSYNNGCTEVRNAGLGALGVGAAMTAVGLLVVFPSMKTDLSQERSAPSKDAFVRSPTWLSAAARGAEGRPLPPTFSLFDARF